MAKYSPLELRNALNKVVLADTARLGNLGYSPYPGKTLSPMSSLTQRGQALGERRAAKGMPYQGSLARVSSANNTPLAPEDIQGLLGMLHQQQAEFGQNVLGRKLQKQYGEGFAPFQERYNRKLGQDIETKLGETGVNIGNVNTSLSHLQGKRNRAAAQVLTNESVNKALRNKSLVESLQEFGTQKHNITNKQLLAEKGRFEEERNEPAERLANLKRALGGVNVEEEHPDIAALNGQQLLKAAQAYGSAISIPVSGSICLCLPQSREV